MPPARQKATTLFNFLSFIEFPPATLPRPGCPVIGVTGADSVYDELGRSEVLFGFIGFPDRPRDKTTEQPDTPAH
ncbi:MAG: hypothetical protein QM749_11930, partial [Aquabacterium sp.]